MSINVASIIGAGLCGLALALFLKKHNIDSTIYELRTSGQISAGAIMLSPNALRSLDAIGVYDRIKSKGYHFRDLTFRNDEHKVSDAYEMGNADKYGYDALRIYRQVLLDELKAMVREAEIEVHYDKRFSHVVSEDEKSITFAFKDGETKSTQMLVGADGIHSAVREHIQPNVKARFDGVMALTCAIATKDIKFPFEPYSTPVSIHGPAGAFVLAAQNPEGAQMLGGIQYRTHDRTRAEWDALWHDKPQLLSIMRQGNANWNAMVQSALDAIPLDTISIWAFHSVPHLESWKSKAGKVVILGDAAHATPPAAGQGINQGFEDVHSLSLLIAARKSHDQWVTYLDRWQSFRSERVERVSDLTNQMTKRRVPGWTGEGAGSIDSAWLFEIDIEREMSKITVEAK
ncbi:hypothetical protein LTR78_008352 [Recurvomyces mirabilis]|uniref:FAD-binding domain-containing protein n=1 Tax=Recurvomyces mirabilis TaxID=574656 RepID=A0AAE0WIW4_9PEZI|nr:hypothetical protein LTR78_008352 [Recurvomyces mirabilis]KAK5158521.1 hypothetical protein LTS14_003541 [Recurvomyces mirabilis]